MLSRFRHYINRSAEQRELRAKQAAKRQASWDKMKANVVAKYAALG